MLEKNTLIVLNAEQMNLAKEVGAARYANSRANSVHDGKVSERTAEFIDYNGAAGEIAMLSMLLNAGVINADTFLEGRAMLLDTALKSAANGKDTGDLILNDGSVVDVKATHYENGCLLAKGIKLNNAISGFAVVVGDVESVFSPNTFRFAGYKTAQWMVENRDSLPIMDNDKWRFNGKPSRRTQDHKYGRVSENFWIAQKDLDDVGQQTMLFPYQQAHPMVQDPETWQNGTLSADYMRRHGLYVEDEDAVVDAVGQELDAMWSDKMRAELDAEMFEKQ